MLPIRPKPFEWEALSSWLSRAAARYGVDYWKFVRVYLQVTPRHPFDLDYFGDQPTIEAASIAFAVSESTIWMMTMRGRLPAYFMLLSNADNSKGRYLAHTKIPGRPFTWRSRSRTPVGVVRDWWPWRSNNYSYFRWGCRMCMQLQGEVYYFFFSNYTVASTCPVHGCGLMPTHQPTNIDWLQDDQDRAYLDQLTFQNALFSAPSWEPEDGMWLIGLRSLIEYMYWRPPLYQGARTDLRILELNSISKFNSLEVESVFESISAKKQLNLLAMVGRGLREKMFDLTSVERMHKDPRRRHPQGQAA